MYYKIILVYIVMYIICWTVSELNYMNWKWIKSGFWNCLQVG